MILNIEQLSTRRQTGGQLARETLPPLRQTILCG